MYWLLYDIKDNKKRNKLVKICLDCGMRRIQKSCFLGQLKKEKREKIFREIERLCIASDEHILFYPFSEHDLARAMQWGRAEKLALKQEESVFVF